MSISCTAFCQKKGFFLTELDSAFLKIRFEDDIDRAYSVFSKQELLGLSLFGGSESMECRLDNLSDSLIEYYAKYDAFYSMRDSVKKYYEIGNASGSPFNTAPKIAKEKYNLILVYTHCTPCKYQLKYSHFFEKFYLERYSKSIRKLISEIEKEAREEEIRIYEENRN